MTDTTTTIVPSPLHLAVVYGNGYEHWAECSFCGWASEWHQTAVAAGVAGAEHRDAAAGPPDEMDRLMNDLLDLQDDLAELVVWLAENWSADLPIPKLLGASHYERDGHRVTGAGAWVLAWASDPGAVERAAARLGVPVTVDAEQNSSGERYRRAVRWFGRVEVEVCANVGESAM